MSEWTLKVDGPPSVRSNSHRKLDVLDTFVFMS
jgi:hypothetical protein